MVCVFIHIDTVRGLLELYSSCSYYYRGSKSKAVAVCCHQNHLGDDIVLLPVPSGSRGRHASSAEWKPCAMIGGRGTMCRSCGWSTRGSYTRSDAGVELSGSSFCVSGLSRGVSELPSDGGRRPDDRAKSLGDESILYSCVSGLNQPGSPPGLALPL